MHTIFPIFYISFQDPLLSDFRRLQQQKPLKPLSLEESFTGVRDGIQKPRLHLPRTINSQPSISNPRLEVSDHGGFQRQNLLKDPKKETFLGQTKIITNPLLQKLFNRDRISVVESVNESDQILRPSAVRTRPPPTTRRTTTRRSATRPSFTRRTTTRPSFIRRPTSRPSPTLPPLVQPSSITSTTTQLPRTTRRTTPRTTPATISTTPGRAQPRFEPRVQPSLFDQIKNRINNAKQKNAQVDDASEDNLMNALIQQRVEEELARRRQQEQERIEEERQKLLSASNNRRKYEELISAANDAVKERVVSGTDKSSPAVWAAVRSLTSFISSRHQSDGGDVPDKVKTAVTQLTRFLTEEAGVSQEQEEVSVQQIQKFMKGEGGETDTETFLPNLELQKLPRKQFSSDKDLEFPLLEQFGKELDLKKVTLDIPGSNNPVPDKTSNDNIISTFKFSTLPV